MLGASNHDRRRDASPEPRDTSAKHAEKRQRFRNLVIGKRRSILVFRVMDSTPLTTGFGVFSELFLHQENRRQSGCAEKVCDHLVNSKAKSRGRDRDFMRRGELPEGINRGTFFGAQVLPPRNDALHRNVISVSGDGDLRRHSGSTETS